jgi:prevent-host-death family protein
MRRWQLQDAKARLSEVVKRTEREGPQEISVRGRPAAVVLSAADYGRLRGSGQRSQIETFLKRSAAVKVDLEIARDRSAARDLDL